MKTLCDHHRENLPELNRKLENATTIEEVSTIIQNEIGRLMHIDGPYIGSLTQQQARMATSMLEAFQLAFEIIPVALPQDTIAENFPKQTATRLDRNKFQKVDNELISGALGGAAAGIYYGGILGAMLGSLGGALVGFGVRHFNSPQNGAQEFQKTVSPPSIDKKSLLTYIQQAFEVIDRVVENFSNVQKPIVSKPSLNDHPEVLAFFQNLISETTFEQDSSLSQSDTALMKELEAVLRKYGIRTEAYKPDSRENEGVQMFEFETSLVPDNKDYITVKPALIQGDKVLMPGLVLEPSGN